MQQQDDIWQQINSGQWYQTQHPQLLKAREQAKRLCGELNQLNKDQDTQRRRIVQQLLPNASNAWVGNDFGCDYGINIFAEGELSLGDRVVILDAAPVRFGMNVKVADGVVIASLTHPLAAAKRKAGWQQATPVIIGNGVVLGHGSSILPGATIPAGTNVKPGTVITATTFA